MKDEKETLGYFNNTNVFLMSFLELGLSFHINTPTVSFRLMNNETSPEYTPELVQVCLPLTLNICFIRIFV